jgi:hypothetical protein
MRAFGIIASAVAWILLDVWSASAQTIRFPDVTLEGLTFSGLLFDQTSGNGGQPQYTLMCVATTEEATVYKSAQITFFILSSDDTVIGSAQFPGGPWNTKPGFSARCDQPITNFRRGGQPAKLKVQVYVTASTSFARLVPKPQGDGTFESVTLDRLVYSGLAAQIASAQGRSRYIFGCFVTAPANEVRTLQKIEFFMWAKDATAPFVWRETTGMPLVLGNGNTKDCSTDSGPLPSYNLDVSGMSIQISEQDPSRHSSMVVTPVANRSR